MFPQFSVRAAHMVDDVSPLANIGAELTLFTLGVAGQIPALLDVLSSQFGLKVN
jgi:hypothetical protein